MDHQIHTYSALLRQIHNDLRVQHPDWIQPNGDSPLCDSYEARLMKLLDGLDRTESQRDYRCSGLPAGWIVAAPHPVNVSSSVLAD